MLKFAEIAFNLPIADETFTYDITDIKGEVLPGMRAEAEINSKIHKGIVIEVHTLIPPYKVKPVKRIVDKEPVVNPAQLQLARWMSDYYLSSFGESLFKMVPQGKRVKEKPPLPGTRKPDFELNAGQRAAFDRISADFGKNAIHLIHGVTGSGKTEVYIHLIRKMIEESDKNVILLVPEISLTFQMIQRLEKVFGSDVAVIHSGLKTSQRFTSYVNTLHGKKRIVVGTRSAVFAPLENIGMVIIDEEHDSSYKDHSSPRYHARQVALQRCIENKAVLVLGSATPSVEVFFLAKTGKITLSKISERTNKNPMPVVHLEQPKPGELIGNNLLFQIKKRMEKKEQVILLLNRRGHSPLLYRKDTKEFVQCPNCSVNICYHSDGKAVCHFCGYSSTLAEYKNRYGDNLELKGAGTQKLEEYILERFSNIKLERLDQDSARKRDILQDVIERFLDGEIDILTGTQMIAKGLDAERVTLIGVVNAGIGLGLPDFRSSERVFSVITQVAGRAGRSSLPGEVFIETYDMENPVIQLAVKQDYDTFFEREIAFRNAFKYPPFSRLIRFVARSAVEKESSGAIEKVFSVLEKKTAGLEGYTEIMGPAPCPFYKIDSNYRNHIIIKTNHPGEIKKIIKEEILTISLGSKVYLELDIDPVDIL